MHNCGRNDSIRPRVSTAPQDLVRLHEIDRPEPPLLLVRRLVAEPVDWRVDEGRVQVVGAAAEQVAMQPDV